MQGPITANLRIRDLLERYPEALRVFHDLGIRCEECHRARYETIAEGARVHDLPLEPLLEKLNAAVRQGLPSLARLPVHTYRS